MLYASNPRGETLDVMANMGLTIWGGVTSVAPFFFFFFFEFGVSGVESAGFRETSILSTETTPFSSAPYEGERDVLIRSLTN